MGNVLTTNPVWVDETGSIFTHPVSIQAILWVSDDATNKDIAADDDMKILDEKGGNIICSKRAETSNDNLEISFPKTLHTQGIYVEELDGGVLLIYI